MFYGPSEKVSYYDLKPLEERFSVGGMGKEHQKRWRTKGRTSSLWRATSKIFHFYCSTRKTRLFVGLFNFQNIIFVLLNNICRNWRNSLFFSPTERCFGYSVRSGILIYVNVRRIPTEVSMISVGTCCSPHSVVLLTKIVQTSRHGSIRNFDPEKF